MADIVIDTNILMHANNNQESTQGICINLINYLLGSDEMICIDRAIDVDKSAILHEYFDKLKTPGTTGRSFVEKILTSKRFAPKTRDVHDRIRKLVNQTINNNKATDKIFIKITCNSNNRTFISHDFEDFQSWKRDLFEEELDIKIIVASDFSI